MRTSDPRFINFMIADAIRAGKFPKSREPHYRRLFASDPDGATALIERLAPALANAQPGAADDPLPAHWFPELARGGPEPAVREEPRSLIAGSRPRPPAAQEEGLPAQWFPE